MKSFIISLLTSLLIFSHAFAQVINAEFKPADDIAKIKEGDMSKKIGRAHV